jgi:hypothetical protein
MGDVVIFHEHLVYFADILYILWLGIWYILLQFGVFLHFGILYHEKSGNPGRCVKFT